MNATHAACANRARSTPRSALRTATRIPRAAFTLIEMMVVICIIAIIAAITLGSIFGTRTVNRLLATEQLIGDLVRQARHTARSTGAPVVLRITRDAPDAAGNSSGATIAGVSRIPLWTEPFEGPTVGSPNAIPLPSAPHLGVTGYGWWTGGTAASGVAAATGPAGPPPFAALDRNQEITRGNSARRLSDGFYLACTVNPKQAAPNATPIPLLLVGDSADIATSLCGLILVPDTRAIQKVSGATANLASYEIVGWVRPQGALAPVEVSSLDSADIPTGVLRDEPLLHPSVSGETHPNDIAGPLAGGRWEELGLLYDGERLVLYRNGRRVGEKLLPTGSASRLPTGGAQIHIGEAGTQTADATCFDDCRLYRLATDQLGRLPGQVVPNDDYQIVAHPDGRVEVNVAAAAATAAGVGAGAGGTTLPNAVANANASTTIAVTIAMTNRVQHADITITVDGRVSSALQLDSKGTAAAPTVAITGVP